MVEAAATPSVSAISRRLEGKVAIITGGASGIGASSVQIFHKNGAKVVIADLQDGPGQALANKLGENACYIHCDVANEDDVCNLIATTIDKYGTLDIMFNNAGIIDQPFAGILDTTKADLERVLRVNVVGSFLGAKHAARVMVPNRKGCILFTASAATEIAGLGTPAYTLTKYEIVELAMKLAAELRQYGVRVNCVSPYAVPTAIGGPPNKFMEICGEMVMSETGNLKGHVLRAEGVAQAALYLASDGGSCVTGMNLVVDGGYSVVNPTFVQIINGGVLTKIWLLLQLLKVLFGKVLGINIPHFGKRKTV